MEANIFKENDIVFHHILGEGVVEHVNEYMGAKKYCVKFKYGVPNQGDVSVYMKKDYLSFKHYTLEKGGFTQSKNNG